MILYGDHLYQTNDAIDTEASVIVDKLLQLKYFLKEKLFYCKIVLSRPI